MKKSWRKSKIGNVHRGILAKIWMQPVCTAWFAGRDKYADLLKTNVAMTRFIAENLDVIGLTQKIIVSLYKLVKHQLGSPFGTAPEGAFRSATAEGGS